MFWELGKQNRESSLPEVNLTSLGLMVDNLFLVVACWELKSPCHSDGQICSRCHPALARCSRSLQAAGLEMGRWRSSPHGFLFPSPFACVYSLPPFLLLHQSDCQCPGLNRMLRILGETALFPGEPPLWNPLKRIRGHRLLQKLQPTRRFSYNESILLSFERSLLSGLGALCAKSW